MSAAEEHTDLARLETLIARWDSGTPVLVLTGAGISAESGIPTFRGEGGMWVRGSRNYAPQELATHAMFVRQPEDVWAFYLERIERHRGARPNAGHLALVELERGLAERFLLVTQNVDGLHARAGSDPERTFCIHGRLDSVRCSEDCGLGIVPLPDGLVASKDDGPLPKATRERLNCPRCGGWLRPHVLWFDEYYDEQHFRFESSLRAAQSAGLVLVVGTSGATNLPMQIVQVAQRRAVPFIVVDPADGPFQALAAASERGVFLRGRAGDRLPEVVAAILDRGRR